MGPIRRIRELKTKKKFDAERVQFWKKQFPVLATWLSIVERISN